MHYARAMEKTDRTKKLGTCMLCEACCGIVVDIENGAAVSVRGDEEDLQIGLNDTKFAKESRKALGKAD